MTEFVGRTGAQRVYSWPENPRAAALALFARNFATGPKINTDIIDGGIRISWNSTDVAAPSAPFTIVPTMTTVSIAGDVAAQLHNGDIVTLTPILPFVGAPAVRQITTVPVFGGVFTTFSINMAIDGVTTAGVISDSANVPITPRATGVVRISGVVTFLNSSGSPIDLATVQVQVNGITLPSPDDARVGPLADEDVITIPFLAETTPTDTPIGTTALIQILVTGVDATLFADDSVLDVQEVSIATG
jgi:hypothetical protein